MENKDLGIIWSKLSGQVGYLSSNVCGYSSVKHVLESHLLLLQFDDFTDMRKLKCFFQQSRGHYS